MSIAGDTIDAGPDSQGRKGSSRHRGHLAGLGDRRQRPAARARHRRWIPVCDRRRAGLRTSRSAVGRRSGRVDIESMTVHHRVTFPRSSATRPAASSTCARKRWRATGSARRHSKPARTTAARRRGGSRPASRTLMLSVNALRAAHRSGFSIRCDPDNFHNRGDAAVIAGGLTWTPSDSNIVSARLGHGRSSFEVPNTGGQEDADQDQQQRISAQYGNLYLAARVVIVAALAGIGVCTRFECEARRQRSRHAADGHGRSIARAPGRHGKRDATVGSHRSRPASRCSASCWMNSFNSR